MVAAKMETAAQRYLRQKAEKEVLHDVTCEHCGAEWKCKRQSKEFWIQSGIMPAQLAVSLVQLSQEPPKDEKALIDSVGMQRILEGIEFTSKVVRHTAVEPKIVDSNPDPEKNEIGADQVTNCCYATLRDWQGKGGDEAERLSNFPQE